MTREEFFAINDQKFLSHGFKKVDTDPFFYYEMLLVSEEQIEEQGIYKDDVPALLYGKIELTNLNKGYCIYTGAHFLWLSCDSIEDAIALSKKIVSFEEC